MTRASDYLALAALLMLEEAQPYPTDREQLARAFESTYSYECNDDWAEIIVRHLQHWGAISVHHDEFAGETFRIFGSPISEAVARLRETEFESIISSAKYEGAPWFKRVFENQNFWPKLHSELHEDPTGPSFEAPDFRNNLVPASDRIVTTAHNQAEIEVIKVEIIEIKRILAEDNEVGDALADDREIIDAELDVASEVVESEKFRLASLWGWLLPALRSLSKRFAGTLVDEAVKRLIQALESLI